MDLFRGKTLIQKDGSEHLADDVLKDASVLALFFSAGWCPSCRLFTPLLARAYKAQRKVEVVFVSEDRSSFAMIGYMRQSHGDWYAVKYGDPLQDCLRPGRCVASVRDSTRVPPVAWTKGWRLSRFGICTVFLLLCAPGRSLLRPESCSCFVFHGHDTRGPDASRGRSPPARRGRRQEAWPGRRHDDAASQTLRTTQHGQTGLTGAGHDGGTVQAGEHLAPSGGLDCVRASSKRRLSPRSQEGPAHRPVYSVLGRGPLPEA
ncbi:hypothetical protein V5799_003615 [Amblyomma americanum]|uniref:Thioredoxin-like fold domain-containing protein n=1 Tax=Amblyomma americanum TaxID=6943 RepID=A0AAQ4D8H1_AMBAM